MESNTYKENVWEAIKRSEWRENPKNSSTQSDTLIVPGKFTYLKLMGMIFGDQLTQVQDVKNPKNKYRQSDTFIMVPFPQNVPAWNLWEAFFGID